MIFCGNTGGVVDTREDVVFDDDAGSALWQQGLAAVIAAVILAATQAVFARIR
jgi:hypothetical protein